jgi:hypothetical protein
MCGINHRFGLSKPALMSAPSKKSFSRANCPILACSVLRSGVSDGASSSPQTRPRARASSCCFHSVTLCRVDAELLGQFGERLVAVDGGHGHLRLEGRSMSPSRSFHGLAPLVLHHLVALREARLPLSTLSEFAEPPLNTGQVQEAMQGAVGARWTCHVSRIAKCLIEVPTFSRQRCIGNVVTFPRFHRHLQKEENDEIGGQHEHEDTTVVYGGV